ncbi:MAG: integrase arm-type DNA-binding domain-containing protein [Porticoccaceae bacterium]|nr:integrase arm-type DNA-binding domain-containing protein [Porticoccaceae bacterium]
MIIKDIYVDLMPFAMLKLAIDYYVELNSFTRQGHMSKSPNKITKKVLDAWVFDEKDPFLWDPCLQGFVVRLNANGSYSFLVKYRTKYGDRRTYTVGKSSAITVDQARSQAEKILARIALEGFDPLEQKQSDRNALTINELLDAYLTSAKFQEKAKSTQSTDAGRLNRHIRPLLGKVRLEQLTPDQVRKAFAGIRDGKTACSVKTKPRGRARVSGGEQKAPRGWRSGCSGPY